MPGRHAAPDPLDADTDHLPAQAMFTEPTTQPMPAPVPCPAPRRGRHRVTGK